MYTPSHFRSDDLDAIHAVIRCHPLGLLVTAHAGELHATHLPFRLDPGRGAKGTLEGHLARANPHCAALEAGAESLVVFKGPDGYISPRWYADPAKNVPTWNYVAVHVHGHPEAIRDPDALLTCIGRLTDEHEVHIDRPWHIAEAQTHAERLLPHILGFALPIERLEGKFKLSQNRSAADRVGVLRALANSHGRSVEEMLELMRRLYREDGEFR